jgi:hypothetical protein
VGSSAGMTADYIAVSYVIENGQRGTQVMGPSEGQAGRKIYDVLIVGGGFAGVSPDA